MGANTTKEVAWLTGAAKDDTSTLLAGSTGALTSNSFTVASLLANDPGSSTFYGIYGTATPYSNASTKTPMDPSSGVATTSLGGTVTWNKTTGTLTYTKPASVTDAMLQALPAGQSISDTFYYVIWMGNKGAYSIASATIKMTGIDDAANITGTVDGSVVEDVTTSATGTLSIVDPDTGESGFNAAALAGAYGMLTLTPVSTGSGSTPGSANWTYALNHDLANSLKEGEVHTETFTLNSKGGTPVTVTITVTGTNDAPTAVADAATTGENASVTIDAVANDTDPDHDHVLSLVSVDSITGGGAAAMVDGKVVFDPGTDFDHLAQGKSATVTIGYTMQDEHGATSSSTITVTVNGENDAPTAHADSATTDEDTAVTVDVLANDTDPDDDHVLSIASIDGVTGGGGASIIGGKLVFDPGTEFNHLAQGDSATVTIDYTMKDEFGATSSSTVTVTVEGTNDGPTANADSATTDEDTSVAVSVLANDTDPDDHHTLSLVGIDSVAGGGSASVNGDDVVFDPGTAFNHLAQGDSATVTVTYTMQDEHGAQSSADVTITVDGVNDGPTANNDAASTDQNTAVTIDALANDTDPDDHHTLSMVGITGVTGGGTATIDQDGNVVFDPGSDFAHLAAGSSETVVIGYTMQDEFGAQSSASISVEVNGLNDAATMGGEYTGSVTEDGTLIATGFLTVHDIDDGENGFASISNPALHGTYGDFTFDGNTGNWSYLLRNNDAIVQALNTGDHPTDTLTVSSIDGTASETITVTVNGVDEPVVVNLSTFFQVNHGGNQSDHQTINGFDSNDVLKMDGHVSYVGFTTSGSDTVVTFLDNGGNKSEQFDVTLVGYTGFDPHQVI